MAAPGLDLPAEGGLSGKVVLRFGGVSCGKSGRLIDSGRDRIREPGELGLDMFPTFLPFEDGAIEDVGVLRVGVDGRIVDDWGRGLAVDGLMVLSMEVVVWEGWVLEGVEAREVVVREEVVDGLAADEEQLLGVDGLM